MVGVPVGGTDRRVSRHVALVGIEALLWGVYGVGHGDPANISFGVIGTFAAVAILIRTVPSRAAKMARCPT